jgi:hypothetical protein
MVNTTKLHPVTLAPRFAAAHAALVVGKGAIRLGQSPIEFQ